MKPVAFPSLRGLCALTALVAAAPTLRAGDELVVSSYTVDHAGRFNGDTGQFVDNLDPASGLAGPQAMIVGPDGLLYIASEKTDSVLRFDLATRAYKDTFVASGAGGLDGPTGITFDTLGNLLVASFETDEVLKFDGQTGAPLGALVSAGSGGLNGPDTGTTIGPDGNLYVPSYWNSKVIRYDGLTGAVLNEQFVAAGVGGLKNPRSLEFRDGLLYIASEGSGRIIRVKPTDGTLVDIYILGNGLSGPTGLAWDSSGNLIVADVKNDNVRWYDRNGISRGVYIAKGVGGLIDPTFLRFLPRADFTEQAQFGTGSTLSLAWGDADGDDDFDLAIAESGGKPNSLWTNNGDGSFGGQSPFFGTGSTFAVCWGDYDNDGDQDCAVGNSGQNYLYINAGGGVFTQSAQFGLMRTIALAWGDYDLDGDLDMAVGNGILGQDEQNALYVNNGDGSFTPEDQFGMGQTDSLAWGDCDGDGDLDLAVGNGGYAGPQQSRLYINNGDGSFTGRDEFGFADTAAVAWGDCDNDGDLDLAVGNWGGDHSRLYLNDGDGNFAGSDAFGSRDTNTISWMDFDNDGDLDIAAGNGDFQSGDQTYFYVNELVPGVGPRFTEMSALGFGSTDAIAWCDFDSDGDLDAAVGNEHHPAVNYLYVNNENDGHMLTLHLVGRFHDRGAGYSNRGGVGARVLVYAPGHLGEQSYLRGMRQVESTSGFSPGHSIDVEFGLPGDLNVDVRIIWPGSAGASITQDLTGVPVGGRRVVEEAAPCYPDLDTSGSLDLFDFLAFTNLFNAGDPDADCDGDGAFNLFDFLCFVNSFNAGC